MRKIKKPTKEFIESELKNLDVPLTSRAYETVFHNAIEAADIMNKSELREYIEQSIELLPNTYFEE